VHHRPVGPPFTARLTGALTRWGLLLRGSLRYRTGRLVLGGAMILGVTALVLTIPVVSGRDDGTPTVALDASSSASPAADGSSPVVMGVDGQPLRSAAFAGAIASGTTSSDVTAASGTTQRGSGTTSSDGSPGTTSSRASSQGASGGGAGDTVDAPAPGPSSSGGPASSGTSSSPGSSADSSLSGDDSTGSPISGSDSPPSSEPTGSGSGGTAPSPASVPGAGEQVLALVNDARARSGCDALVRDATLAATAQAHSAAMRDRGFLSLDDPINGSVLDHGARAGMVAQGTSDPAAVVAGWLADATDRAAILDCGLDSMGVGVADGAGGPWWTQLLA
jgi:uncharacterized protein YkwD